MNTISGCLYADVGLARLLPVIQEEAVLDQDVEKKIDEAFDCHESDILSHKVPPERVLSVFLT